MVAYLGLKQTRRLRLPQQYNRNAIRASPHKHERLPFRVAAVVREPSDPPTSDSTQSRNITRVLRQVEPDALCRKRPGVLRLAQRPAVQGATIDDEFVIAPIGQRPHRI